MEAHQIVSTAASLGHLPPQPVSSLSPHKLGENKQANNNNNKNPALTSRTRCTGLSCCKRTLNYPS